MVQMQQINDLLAERLRALRISKGVSHKALADAIGKNPNTITRTEKGSHKLTAAELVCLARTLGVQVSVLVGEIPANAPDNGGHS